MKLTPKKLRSYNLSSMIPIGHSTGWLASRNVCHSLQAQMQALCEAGSDAIQIIWQDQLLQGSVIEQSSLAPFHHVSLHLKDFTGFIPASEELSTELSVIQQVSRALSVEYVIVHPPNMTEEIYQKLHQLSLTVTVENMDRKQKSGVAIAELQVLGERYDTRFCLDLQHAYEQSIDAGRSGDALGKEYASMMLEGNRLAVLHVSGEISQSGKQLKNHAALHRATNQEDILKMLCFVLEKAPIPIILEGDYLPEIPDEYTPENDEERADLLSTAINNMREECEWLLQELV